MFEKQGPYKFPKLPDDGVKRSIVHEKVSPKGGIYSGQVNAATGEADGIGTIILKDGRIYQGLWKNNNKHGQGRVIDFGGDCYEGEYKDGNRDGQGK